MIETCHVLASSADVATCLLRSKTIDRFLVIFAREVTQGHVESNDEVLAHLADILVKLTALDEDLQMFSPSEQFFNALVQCIRVKSLRQDDESDASDKSENLTGAARFLLKRVTSSCRYISNTSMEERDFRAKLANVLDLEQEVSETSLKYNKRFYEVTVVDETGSMAEGAPAETGDKPSAGYLLQVRVTSLQPQSTFVFANVGAKSIELCEAISKRIESVPESERLHLKRAPAPSKYSTCIY